MIKKIGHEMNEFVKDMKENIKDQKILNYVLERTEKLYGVLQQEIEEVLRFKEQEMQQIKEKQSEQESKLRELSQKIDDMHYDLYDDGMYFEITCPYCNYKFEANFNEKIKQMNCPECNNIIELDWTDDDDFPR